MNCDRRIKLEGSKLPCQFYIRTGVQNQPGFCSLPWHFRCVEAVARMIPRLSKSSIEEWDVCRRKYLLDALMGVRLRSDKEPVAMVAGALWDWFVQILHKDKVVMLDALAEFHDLCKQKADENDSYKFPMYRVMALATALVELDFQPFSGIVMQKEYMTPISSYMVKGVMDGWIAPKKAILECKLTSSPDWYFDLYNIHLQSGMYFLLEPSAEKLYQMVARIPDLKRTGQYKDEEPDDHYTRTLKDIRKRPTHYFPGWVPDDKQFYKVYYRNEFDIAEIEIMIGQVGREIKEACQADVTFFRQRKTSCGLWGHECEYLDICKTGVISEGKYTERRPDEPMIVDSEFMQELRKESDARIAAKRGLQIDDGENEVIAGELAQAAHKSKKKRGKLGKLETILELDFTNNKKEVEQ